MNADKRGSNIITEKIIGCAYVAANTLGSGFLEKVYGNAMAHATITLELCGRLQA